MRQGISFRYAKLLLAEVMEDKVKNCCVFTERRSVEHPVLNHSRTPILQYIQVCIT